MERKYFRWEIKPLNYGFLFSKSINNIYIYEENERYFEFFTGIEFIKHSYDSNKKIYLTLSDSMLKIFIYDHFYENPTARPLTATIFADAVRPLMKDEDEIKHVLLNFFEQKHQEWLKKEIERKKVEAEKKYIDETNEQWLNSIIDKRN